jgi:hypothetical protein
VMCHAAKVVSPQRRLTSDPYTTELFAATLCPGS